MSDESRDARGGRVVRVFVGTGALYLVLWALTATVGIAGVRNRVGTFSSTEYFVVDDQFDPERFSPPAVPSRMTWISVGRCWSPAPFLIFSDVAVYDVSQGFGERILQFWFFGKFSAFRRSTFWTWKRPP